MTYRENILEADFVILIMKENYGTITDQGISGTHEEYNIAKENNIPTHIYIKKSLEEQNELVKEIKKDNASYYYFETDEDLIKRLKETTFEISKEIILRQISEKSLDSEIIRKIAYNSDYNRALSILRVIEEMRTVERNFNLEYLSTNIFLRFTDNMINMFDSSSYFFVNGDLNILMKNIVSSAEIFINQFNLDYHPGGREIKFNSKELGEMIIHYSERGNADFSEQFDYNFAIKDFFNKYEDFKSNVEKFKTEADLI